MIGPEKFKYWRLHRRARKIDRARWAALPEEQKRRQSELQAVYADARDRGLSMGRLVAPITTINDVPADLARDVEAALRNGDEA